jgi:hypothetical protein
LFWTAFTVALGIAVAGGAIAFVGYRDVLSPAGTVRAYFDALRRGDAAAALGFGDLPSGSRALLTSQVLHAQQRVGSMSDVKIEHSTHAGDAAEVEVGYVLDVSGTRAQVDDSVSLHKAHGGWRMDRVADPTQLLLSGATDRAEILGAVVPTDTTLVFPGVLPISFDTANLQLDAGSAIVHLDHDGGMSIGVLPSSAGRAAAQSAVVTALRSCLGGGTNADPRCPLPSSRAVPESMRGSTSGDVAGGLHVDVGSDPAGLFEVTGTAAVLGHYAALDANNVSYDVRGRYRVSVDALTYAYPPLQVLWQAAAS